ncbi:MAG TPA: acyltransferase family protein [Polyangiaceae bacterium]|jgi:peptidoglycan/LPS O-acetylase OafA/YrhL|nr:acyltransferase family protein [Polyangiaceae bacterium]
MRHRNDIDGLRAIAVLSVVLYHLGFSERIAGGFVGVDIFFVISGYLITGILQAEVDAGRLSLVEFYNRRVRRIFPALFLVHVFCLVASAILLFPIETKQIGQDVLWSLAFLSNVVFARAAGYFDQASKVDPLLHTWSLSVEEQFYIALPVLLWILSRVRPRVRIAILAAIAIVSFAASERMVRVDARHAFYWVQYRAWELLAGSLLALGAVPPVRGRIAAEALGALGLGLIFFAIFAIRSSTPFPGYWAVPPCVGALAILHSGTEVRTLSARLLGSPPLRWVGLVSYSFYLWHWPVIALYNARHDGMTTGVRFAILGLTLAAAVLSYRYVERPFRRKPYRRSARATLLIAACGAASIAVLALGVPLAAARLRPRSELADAALKYLTYEADLRAGTCFLHSGFDDAALFRKDLCLNVRPGRRSFLVMGDSHAAHFVPALAALRPELDILQATASGCEAVRGGEGAKRCTDLFAYVFDEFLPSHHVDTLVLAGRWPRGTLPALLKTIHYVRPFVGRVVVLGPVVEYNRPFPQLLASSITENDPGLPARHLVATQRSNDRFFAARLASSGAEYYSVYQATCPGGECTLWALPGVPMQYDEHHLTLRGAELVLQRLGPGLFGEAMQR